MTLGNEITQNYLQEKTYNPIALDSIQIAELEVALVKFQNGYSTLVNEYPETHEILRHFQNVFSYFTTLGNLYPRFESKEDKEQDLKIINECKQALEKVLDSQPHTSAELDLLEDYFKLSQNKDFQKAINHYHKVSEYNEPIQVIIDALQTFHNHILRFW